jgi:hypothetical protein
MVRYLAVPAVLLGVLAAPGLAAAQSAPDNGAAAANSAPASAAAHSATPASKKIWTNEDIPAVKPGGSTSTSKAKPGTGASSGPAADPATVQHIRHELEKLQGQLDEVNKKLKTYKEFQEGEPVSTGARDLTKGISRVPVDQQMVQLQRKKESLESQISDLNDEARKKGIDPGQLR